MTKFNKSVSENKVTELTSLKPFVDIYEDDEGVTLMAEVPGVDLNQLEIQVEGTVLSLEGKVAQSNAKGAKKELEMIPEGVYRRSFSLGEDLDLNRIDAELKSGLLTIKLPKKVIEAPQRINVRAA